MTTADPIDDIMMTNGRTGITKEDAHWASFRTSVSSLQHSLLAQHSSGMMSGSNATDCYESTRDAERKRLQDAQLELKGNTIASAANHEQEMNDLDHCNAWGGTNTAETEEPHRQLELIGLEEVSRSAHSRNNAAGTDHLASPINAPQSHASHTTNALSIAEQQLAETRLKLAMTESERDELEFQLMQRR